MITSYHNAIIFFLGLFISTMNNPLSAMEVCPTTKKICFDCSRYYFANNECEITGLLVKCNHGFCPDCFLASDAQTFSQARTKFSDYCSLIEFECPKCEKWVSMGKEKNCDAGSDSYLLNHLCVGLRQPRDLVKAIESVRKERGIDGTIVLLKEALSDRGRTLNDIKEDDGFTTLHYACSDKASIKTITIILQTAGNQAWNLVCMKDIFGQTPPFITIYKELYAQSYERQYNYFQVIQELLKTGPSDQARWNLINEKSLRNCHHNKYSILVLAQDDTKKIGLDRQKVIELLLSYQPKDQ